MALVIELIGLESLNDLTIVIYIGSYVMFSHFFQNFLSFFGLFQPSVYHDELTEKVFVGLQFEFHICFIVREGFFIPFFLYKEGEHGKT